MHTNKVSGSAALRQCTHRCPGCRDDDFVAPLFLVALLLLPLEEAPPVEPFFFLPGSLSFSRGDRLPLVPSSSSTSETLMSTDRTLPPGSGGGNAEEEEEEEEAEEEEEDEVVTFLCRGDLFFLWLGVMTEEEEDEAFVVEDVVVVGVVLVDLVEVRMDGFLSRVCLAFLSFFFRDANRKARAASRPM